LRRGHTINLEAPRSLEARADPLWLEQALTNLLDNAAKYGPPDRPVDVTVREDPPDVVISVRDHGDGVPKEAREQLFQPFFRAEPERAEGRGLGLYICRLVAEAHRGAVAAEFPEDGGSRFVLKLPKGG
jgi:signal transduction histidine kinase